MRDFFLIDNSHNKAALRRFKICSTIAHLALFHPFSRPSDRLVAQYWSYPESVPSIYWRAVNLSIANLKWYINKFIKVEDQVWNADFLRGITQYGRVLTFRCSFPTFFWKFNPAIEELFESCPFYFRRNDNFVTRDARHYYGVNSMAALCLSYSEKSISFMAGVLATGQSVTIDDKVYARYNVKASAWIKKWQIPIEQEDYKGRVFVSPLWPALFTPWMPKSFERWTNMDKASNAEKYALIMWKIFTGKDIRTKGIPYLISRRSYYYRYGSIKNLAKKWVEQNMTGMDLRFKEAVQYWEQKTCIIQP